MPAAIGKSIHKWVVSHHPTFDTAIDKHLKWIPFASAFMLDVFGVKTKSGWKKQVLIAGATEAIRYLLADNIKKITQERRPFPYSGKHSFPSGHTSSSFAGAEFLHTEFKNSIPILSCAGYLGATATAVIRVMKSRHWIKDVVGGAVIGIVSAKLAYFLVNKLSRKRKKAAPVNPGVTEEKIENEFAEAS
jgi:membrane-associated phospholipid phosphatase